MRKCPCQYGHFLGSVQAEWDNNHPRDMRLLQDVVYVDPRGETWTAFSGEVINGASTGWFLRRLFPAYVGWYRRATVIHDVYISRKYKPQWKVHLMFFEASMSDGTPWLKAYCMWLGVVSYGYVWEFFSTLFSRNWFKR